MKRVLLALIRFYRKYISPAFPGKCRCNPFTHGDFYDPVP